MIFLHANSQTNRNQTQHRICSYVQCLEASRFDARDIFGSHVTADKHHITSGAYNLWSMEGSHGEGRHRSQRFKETEIALRRIVQGYSRDARLAHFISRKNYPS